MIFNHVHNISQAGNTVNASKLMLSGFCFSIGKLGKD